MSKYGFLFLTFFLFIFIASCQKNEKTRLEEFLNESFLYFSDTTVQNKYKEEFAKRMDSINSINDFDIKVREIQDSINVMIENDYLVILKKNGFLDINEYQKILDSYKKDRYINILSEKLIMLRISLSRNVQSYTQRIVATKLQSLTGENYNKLMDSQQSSNPLDSSSNN